jgi:DMSO reductase iron-sulfur subunit
MTRVKQVAFFFDSSSCSGCKACMMACRDKNEWAGENPWRRVYEVTGGSWVQIEHYWENNLFAYHLSLSCNHCEKPICVEVCPTRSMRKREDGIVYVKTSTCIGCRYCEWACPYESPQYDRNQGKMTKCDFCLDLIDDDKPPACVAACGLRALGFGEKHELVEKTVFQKQFQPLPDVEITQPSLIVNPHRDADPAGRKTIQEKRTK